MTWLDKLKLARKMIYEEWEQSKQSEYYGEKDQDAFRTFILITEAIEEIGRHAKTPLTDWDAPAPKT